MFLKSNIFLETGSSLEFDSCLVEIDETITLFSTSTVEDETSYPQASQSQTPSSASTKIKNAVKSQPAPPLVALRKWNPPRKVSPATSPIAKIQRIADVSNASEITEIAFVPNDADSPLLFESKSPKLTVEQLQPPRTCISRRSVSDILNLFDTENANAALSFGTADLDCNQKVLAQLPRSQAIDIDFSLTSRTPVQKIPPLPTAEQREKIPAKLSGFSFQAIKTSAQASASLSSCNFQAPSTVAVSARAQPFAPNVKSSDVIRQFHSSESLDLRPKHLLSTSSAPTQPFPEKLPTILHTPKFASKRSASDMLQPPLQSPLFAQPICPSNRIVFPSPEHLKRSFPLPTATRIPNEFSSAAHYCQCFTSALIDEINGPLLELATRYAEAFHEVTATTAVSASSASSASPAPVLVGATRQCPRHPGVPHLAFVHKEGVNQGRGFLKCAQSKVEHCEWFSWASETDVANHAQGNRQLKTLRAPHERAEYFRSRRLPFYSSLELVVSKKSNEPWIPDKKKFLQKRAKMQKEGRLDCNSDDENADTLPTRYYLKIPENMVGHYTQYAKDDLWVLSSTDAFDCSKEPTFVVRSLFHAPGRSGVLEVAPVDGSIVVKEMKMLVGLRAPNFGSELQMLDALRSQLVLEKVPIFPFLVQPLDLSRRCARSNSSNLLIPKIKVSAEVCIQEAERVISEFGFNTDQARVIRSCSQWFIPGAESDPVHLLHGVFGSGKSLVLVALVIFLDRLLTLIGDTSVRILVASHTNTAVDRVLLGLKEREIEFCRIGSLRKISKALLCHVVHYSEKLNSNHEDEAAKELQTMLKESTSATDSQLIEMALRDLKLQISVKRAQKLKQIRVVGITCAATAFEIMNGSQFAICLLDECSQMIEPSSLLPIGRFGCERLLLCGDPKQLPPTVQHAGHHVHLLSTGTVNDTTLTKTMFVRLEALGYRPILLRTQYRLHPTLSVVPNLLFYDGHLQNGVTESERAALVSRLPALTFVEIDGVEQLTPGKSFTNAEEINAARLICQLLEKSVPPSEIGIIALYKAQSLKLHDELAIPDLICSTVDAFQGAEKEVILVSTVRSQHIGFIDSPHRFNVAVTRARRHLIVLGRRRVLQTNPLWQALLDRAVCYVSLASLLSALATESAEEWPKEAAAATAAAMPAVRSVFERRPFTAPLIQPMSSGRPTLTFNVEKDKNEESGLASLASLASLPQPNASLSSASDRLALPFIVERDDEENGASLASPLHPSSDERTLIFDREENSLAFPVLASPGLASPGLASPGLASRLAELSENEPEMADSDMTLYALPPFAFEKKTSDASQIDLKRGSWARILSNLD